MKSINTYIFESREIETLSNKERKKELEKWLKNNQLYYEEYSRYN